MPCFRKIKNVYILYHKFDEEIWILKKSLFFSNIVTNNYKKHSKISFSEDIKIVKFCRKSEKTLGYSWKVCYV